MTSPPSEVPPGAGIGPVEPGPPPGAAGAGDELEETPTPTPTPTSTEADDETSSPHAGRPVGAGPPRPVAPPPTPELANLWGWARGYIRQFGWAVAPVWLTADLVPGGLPGGVSVGCCCKDGEGCTAWGKHLVSGLGAAHEESEVEAVWPSSNPQVLAGHVGIAVMTGSESKLLVLDVGSGSAITRARFKMSEHVLTQSTPSHGEHWLFKLADGVAVYGGRREIELGPGLTVLGDGTFVVVGPRRGYEWVGGPKVLVSHGLTPVPVELELALAREKLIVPSKDIHPDDAWRTTPGNPLIRSGMGPRSYTRLGDVRRLIDQHGDRILYTPGLGFRVWTGTGWGDHDTSAQALKSYALRLPEQHRAEADVFGAEGKDSAQKAALKWSKAASGRSTASLLSDLEADDRVLVPSASHWDSEGWIAGLPVVGGVGRLVNLETGEVERDAITRRVSKQLGADFVEGPAGEFKTLWDIGAEGGPGHYFVRYVGDLAHQYGPEFVRLLQRAAGASLFGRRGVTGDVDAVFVMRGPTRSGKSTFSECLVRVGGTYAKAMNAPLLFGDRGSEFHVAAVYGYRVMTFSEPPMGERLNTTMLKTLSGGDTLTGRSPYASSELTFVPEVSLWLSTNHSLEISDEAVWRRLRIFEFAHSIGEGEEDPRIRAALTGASADPAEVRLALAWMLDGAVAWKNEGWGDTTYWDEMRSEERSKHDSVQRWVDESLVVTRSVADTFTHAVMQSMFDYWAIATGASPPALTRTALKDELEQKVIKAGCSYDKRAKHFVGGQIH